MGWLGLVREQDYGGVASAGRRCIIIILVQDQIIRVDRYGDVDVDVSAVQVAVRHVSGDWDDNQPCQMPSLRSDWQLAT